MDTFNDIYPGYSSPVFSNGLLDVVVIGAGLIGPRHAETVANRPDLRLRAIIDHLAKGPSVAARFNVPLFKLIDDFYVHCEENGLPLPHAAIVATPNHTHVAIGTLLASHGINILMEKPLAPSPADCRLLIDFCREKGVVLLVGHHRRFNPYINAARSHLYRVGRPVAVQGAWTLRKPPSYFAEKPWRSSVEKGGGTLMINLVHDLDLLMYLLGPVQRVYAELLPKQRDSEVDEGAVLTLRFANGCCGTFVCSDNATSPVNFEAGTGENPNIPFNTGVTGVYRVFGSDGTLSVPDMTLYHQDGLADAEKSWLQPVCETALSSTFESDEMALDKGQGGPSDAFLPTPPSSLDTHMASPIHTLSRKPQPFDLQLDHFVNLITGQESECRCLGEDAMRALLCINAVTDSIATGLPQMVPSVEAQGV